MSGNKAKLSNQVPSSVNRVYSLIYPELVSLPFTYASGVVLPLMGFWNAVIYIVTSWAAVTALFTGKLRKKGPNRHSFGTSRPRAGTKRRTGSEGESIERLATIEEDRV